MLPAYRLPPRAAQIVGTIAGAAITQVKGTATGYGIGAAALVKGAGAIITYILARSREATGIHGIRAAANIVITYIKTVDY
jgi:hypothetical protein